MSFVVELQKTTFQYSSLILNYRKQKKKQLWHGLPSEADSPLPDKICIDSFFQW